MNKLYRSSNVNSVKIEKVIIVKSVVGEGTKENAFREITEIYDLKGRLITRIDEWKNEVVLPIKKMEELVGNVSNNKLNGGILNEII